MSVQGTRVIYICKYVYNCIISARVMLGTPFPSPFPWNYSETPSAPLIENSGASMQWQVRVTFLELEPQGGSVCFLFPMLQRPNKNTWIDLRTEKYWKYVAIILSTTNMSFDQTHAGQSTSFIWRCLDLLSSKNITTKINIRITVLYLGLGNHFVNKVPSFLTIWAEAQQPLDFHVRCHLSN